jgi:hypothetical protein
MSEKIIAYKAMDKNMQCRGKQYEVGETYHEDKADCCNAGMHACENPFDVLRYYPLRDSPRFFEVECGGSVDKSEEDSKLACTELTVKSEVNFAGLVKATVNAVSKYCCKCSQNVLLCNCKVTNSIRTPRFLLGRFSCCVCSQSVSVL